MNRYLLLGIVVLILVGGVQAADIRLTFQNPNDFIAYTGCYTTGCTWVQNTTGGNSYVRDAMNNGVINSAALPMTYAAATVTSAYSTGMLGLDGSGVSMGWLGSGGSVCANGRIELKMNGTRAESYCNGAFVAYTTEITNPSYVAFICSSSFGVTCAIDDIVWGSTGSKYIFGMPEEGYFLMKDILNPAANGFYRVNTTVANGTPTLLSSTEFTSTFGKGSGTDEALCLEDYGGACYQTYQTGTAYSGNVYWDLPTFFASTAPYGLYVTTIQTQIPSTAPYVNSDRIPYIGSGANIQFDKNSYAVGETAVLTVVVSDAYYDLATYSYHVVIQDIYGTEVLDQPITFSISPHTGTVSYNWLSTDTEGVYYGLIYAKRLSDNEELLMNYDTADLTSTLVVNGYVFDAETTNIISSATVNITQGVTTDSVSSYTDGNYTSTSAFIANQPTTIVASKTGYAPYQHVFTPLYAGAIQINLTLMPTNPAHTGIALGGIVRTPPYNRTVNSATVTINKTGIGHYIATTNSAGYYIQNTMPNGTIWDIWGSKTGFANSSIYQKLVVGI